jgi:L-malate glycosyltransferase
MCTGNGAYIVHKRLERHIPSYRVIAYDPYWTLFPPLLPLLCAQPSTVVHTTADHAVFLTRKRTHLVLTFHNYVLDSAMRPYSTRMQQMHYRTDLRLFTRLALKRADRVTAVSRATAELVQRDLQFTGPIQVIQNGVKTDLFHPPRGRSSSSKIRVLFSGNPTRRKGAHWLPSIADRVESNVSIHLTGGLRDEGGDLRHPRLIQLGTVPFRAMPELYRSMDVLLMPTIREGMSLAVLEAMASGLPVVASDTSSIPELVHHGRGGFLCPIGDTEVMASALNTLAQNPILRQQMGDYNRALIESTFTEEQMVEKYQRLFESLHS